LKKYFTEPGFTLCLNTNRLRGGKRGFTLIEMIMILVILGLLTSIVSVSVMGLFSRGQEEGYDVDERVIQSSVSVFYADVHQYAAGSGGWNEEDAGGNWSSAHNYPTATGRGSGLQRGSTQFIDNAEVFLLVDAAGSAADGEDVVEAAVWMGLLINKPSVRTGGNDTPPGSGNSPLHNERGPYLPEVPESCSGINHSRGDGTYTWIVVQYGRVYGVFTHKGKWYVGYNGSYP